MGSRSTPTWTFRGFQRHFRQCRLSILHIHISTLFNALLLFPRDVAAAAAAATTTTTTTPW
jgi:hypothetical protein